MRWFSMMLLLAGVPGLRSLYLCLAKEESVIDTVTNMALKAAAYPGAAARKA
jgi:hypothetical protein